MAKDPESEFGKLLNTVAGDQGKGSAHRLAEGSAANSTLHLSESIALLLDTFSFALQQVDQHRAFRAVLSESSIIVVVLLMTLQILAECRAGSAFGTGDVCSLQTVDPALVSALGVAMPGFKQPLAGRNSTLRQSNPPTQ